ncbi:hypothetical protein MAPG_01528 [Magnaporthiopsis poae ATCC 64411]|uniref:Uncharacterized protein n=1 Tax=Magnaporthiopsis poae (strain ATCC 64411 / 73-15) TaxID=644358 RepID=A0A0C4DNX9_MAGP6|nr:hypothetical protein MAPG_01528 [Magnaporthiopsis poae ATCC 64411]
MKLFCIMLARRIFYFTDAHKPGLTRLLRQGQRWRFSAVCPRLSGAGSYGSLGDLGCGHQCRASAPPPGVHARSSCTWSNATLQFKPFLHDLFVEPSGRFIVVFNRGTDLLRVYSVRGTDRLGARPGHGVSVRAEGVKTLSPSLTRESVRLRPLFSHLIEYGEALGVAIPSETSAHEDARHVALALRKDNRGA